MGCVFEIEIQQVLFLLCRQQDGKDELVVLKLLVLLLLAFFNLYFPARDFHMSNTIKDIRSKQDSGDQNSNTDNTERGPVDAAFFGESRQHRDCVCDDQQDNGQTTDARKSVLSGLALVLGLEFNLQISHTSRRPFEIQIEAADIVHLRAEGAASLTAKAIHYNRGAHAKDTHNDCASSRKTDLQTSEPGDRRGRR